MTPSDLDPDVRHDLRGLQKETAESVARHLVAAGLLVDEDPEQALEHARYARRRAARIAVVREAAGIAAYHAGEWNEALGDLRAARRMGGGSGYVPVMADIERALGRPERALDLTRGPEARGLGTAERIELLIVAAGARRDLGEVDAAVVGLQVPELESTRRDPWSARLFYAYADNLLAAGRRSEAVQWFVHAYDADADVETDAAARIADLTGEAPPGADMDDDSFLLGEEDVPVEDTPVGGLVADPDAADLGDVSTPTGDGHGGSADRASSGVDGSAVDADLSEAAAAEPATHAAEPGADAEPITDAEPTTDAGSDRDTAPTTVDPAVEPDAEEGAGDADTSSGSAESR